MKKVLSAVLLAALGTVISASASADDKVIPGLSCAKVGTSGTSDVDSWGKIRNLSTTGALRVVCPIVKDDASGSVNTVRVRGLDSTTVDQVSCSVGATGEDQDVVYWSAISYSGGAGNNLAAGWYDIQITPRDIGVSGSVFVSCVLPVEQTSAPSSIVSIYWDET